jgi:hypothetical protein
MVYAPVKLASDATTITVSNPFRIPVQNYYSFTNLSELETRWELRNTTATVISGVVHADVAPLTTGTIEVKLPENELNLADALRISFYGDNNREIAAYEIPLKSKNEGHEFLKQVQTLKSRETELDFPAFRLIGCLTHHDGRFWRTVDRWPARLANITTTGTQNREMAADIIMDALTSGPAGKLHATLVDHTLNYTLTWTGPRMDVQELGWVFSVPGSCNQFSWKKQGPWSVYPENHIGRLSGTAFPDSANVRLTKIRRPDAFDFNSTKYNCDWVKLTSKSGSGVYLQFEPDNRHHVRGGILRGEGNELIVNRQCSPPDDISKPVVPDLYMRLQKGKKVTGKMKIWQIR